MPAKAATCPREAGAPATRLPRSRPAGPGTSSSSPRPGRRGPRRGRTCGPCRPSSPSPLPWRSPLPVGVRRPCPHRLRAFWHPTGSGGTSGTSGLVQHRERERGDPVVSRALLIIGRADPAVGALTARLFARKPHFDRGPRFGEAEYAAPTAPHLGALPHRREPQVARPRLQDLRGAEAHAVVLDANQ